MKNTATLFLMLFASHFCISQNPNIKRTNHWYFGEKAGLDFSNGSPIVDTNSQMMVAGNSVTMSDTAGNLLFYSNRYDVWNRNHQIMPNGTGLIQWGTNSFSHALCVPQPGNDNLYYIFYWEYDSTGFDINLEYAIVDMSMDAGLGDIITKRIFLMNKPMEGPGAVLHANGEDIWIVTMKYNSNSFYAFLLTNTGMDTTPVISSNIGMITNNLFNLQFSPDKKKVATTTDWYQIFDFNNSTGVVSNPIVFPPCFCNPYGVAFSPDGALVYFTGYKSLGFPKTANALYQVTLTGDSATTVNSRILLDTIVTNDTIGGNGGLGLMGGMQLANDKKIYITRNAKPILGSISNPNEAGLNCNYSDSVIDLKGRNAAFGFPSFMSSYFYSDSLNANFEKEISDRGLLIFPNPFNEYSTIITNEEKFIYCTAILYDVFGNEVRKILIKNLKTRIDRGNLSAGIYLLNIQHINQSFSQKLVITD